MSDDILTPEEIAKLVQQRKEEDDAPDIQPTSASEESTPLVTDISEINLRGQKEIDSLLRNKSVPPVKEEKKQPQKKEKTNGRGGASPRHSVERVEFEQFPEDLPQEEAYGILPFRQVKLQLNGELGRARVKVKELISLEKGNLLRLDRLADENIILLVNERPYAYGEVVVINDRFGIRITTFISDDHNNDNE